MARLTEFSRLSFHRTRAWSPTSVYVHDDIYILYIILVARATGMALACPFQMSKAKYSYIFGKAAKRHRCRPLGSTETLKRKSIVVLMHAMNAWRYNSTHSSPGHYENNHNFSDIHLVV
jgi:hypothetical protein